MAIASNIDNKRYRGLILSIALFLSLIGTLLAFTFYTSSLLERNTVLIDKTNQVANSAQAVIKDLFDLDNSYGEDTSSPHIQRVLERLEQNSELISNDLEAIATGGTVSDSHGHQNTLPTIKSDVISEEVATAQQQWSLLEPKIKDYLENADNVMVDSADDLTQAVEQAKTSSLLINKSLNDLTIDVFNNAEQQADRIRLIQVIGVVAILAYFIIFVFFFVRRLRESDAEALEARRETQEIMQTVSTGLFLLDQDLNIGQQHSKALLGILGSERLAGENFASILRGRISDKDLNTTRQFVEQLYNPRVKEKLINDLNPLHKVMLHNSSLETAGDNRYLDFKFSRVYEGKAIARILVNVTDVSDAVRLEQRLEQERAQNDMQIEMLTTILNVQPKIFHEFIENTKAHIDKMNNILKNPGSSQFELETKLKSIYREMHSLKGEASALKLHSFTKIAADAEDKLHALQNQGTLSGNDFLPLAVQLDDLLSLSNTIETLGERINQSAPNSSGSQNGPVANVPSDIVSNSNNAPVTNESNHVEAAHIKSTSIETAQDESDSFSLDFEDSAMDGLEQYYQDFAQQIAKRQDKKIQLVTSGLDQSVIPESLSRVVKEISIQLLRNAIVHGVESPTNREANGKPATGHLNLDYKKVDNQLVMTLQDDGQGINYDSIRHRIVATGQHSQEEAASLSQNQLLTALFSSGFTTKDSADEDGGRGVGLDIIKERVKEYQGHLNVSTEKGKMTRFTITLPTAVRCD